MALAVFLLFGLGVILFGSVFVVMTLRHHRQNDLALKAKAASLAKIDALAGERLP